MGWLDRVRSWFAPTPAPANPTERAAPWIPPSWASTTFGPGQPVTPADPDRAPRTFEYTPGVNLTRVPRVAYGLLPFSQLRTIFETVTEVQIPIFVLITELLGLEPHLVDTHGDPLPASRTTDLQWLVTEPDRQQPFHAWLRRFLLNVLVYDAPAVYLDRDPLGRIQSLRVLDGSTIFVLVDERGVVPDPPTPAFTQFIWGQERSLLSRRDLWYVPFRPVPWAPYGWTGIDQALPWILLVARILAHEAAYYTEGNTPEAVATAPIGWTPQQIAAFEELWNEVMTNPAMRRRLRILPNGFELSEVKRGEWPADLYEAARENIALAFGVPVSELGRTPAAGLGGKGYQERMEDAFWRMGVGPLKLYVEQFFNDVLRDLGYADIRLTLQLPSEGPDPAEQAERLVDAFRAGVLTLNEIRGVLGYQPVPDGDRHIVQGTPYLLDLEQAVSTPPSQPPAAPTVPTESTPTASTLSSLAVTKHCGVCPEDDVYYLAPVQPAPVGFPHQGANFADLVALVPDDPTYPPRPAVFKPEMGERPVLRRAAGGPLANREEAAYLLDRLLGLYLVPVSYVTVVNGLRGSVQHYVRGRDPAREPDEYAPLWRAAAGLFDFVTGQFDRHRGNWLTHPDDPDRLILIDNGLSFGRRKAVSPFIAFARAPLPTPLLLAVERALGKIAEQDGRWVRLTVLVGEQQATLARERLERVQALGRVP